jgi:hypothetical protein
MPKYSEQATIGELTEVEFQPPAEQLIVGHCSRKITPDVKSPYEVCFRHEFESVRARFM